MAKKNFKRSPRGIAVYPHLNKPDTKFKKDFGEYHTKVQYSLDNAEAVALRAEVDQAMKAQLATEQKRIAAKVAENKEFAKKMKGVKVALSDAPYKVDEDENTITFSFKMAGGGKSRKTGEVFSQRPAFFDAAGSPLPPETKIGGGSEIRVAYEVVAFEWTTPKIGTGVSLRMRAVQVLKLVEWGGGNASYFGFESEEGDIPGETSEDGEGASTTTEADDSTAEAGESDDF